MKHDLALLGGGLHNSLICLALRHHHPRLRILMLEAAPKPLGNHLWSCHGAELPGGEPPPWLEPAIVARWQASELRFPKLRRRLDGAYITLRSQRLASLVRERMSDGAELLCNAEVAVADGERILLRDGREFRARRIWDGRGGAAPRPDEAGFQKFVGLELRCSAPHQVRWPLLMDATVDQEDGYRFVYVLPLEPDLLLVEDTYFSERPELDRSLLRERVLRYAAEHGWAIAGIEREETGVLPMPWRGLPQPMEGRMLRTGYRGGWFHPATGYSLSIGIRLAESLAADISLLDDPKALRRLANAQRCAARFPLLLNRLQFRWYPPKARRGIYERFFRFDDALIQRFFALRSTRRDKLRILSGRPPHGVSLRWRMGAAARAHSVAVQP